MLYVALSLYRPRTGGTVYLTSSCDDVKKNTEPARCPLTGDGVLCPELKNWGGFDGVNPPTVEEAVMGVNRQVWRVLGLKNSIDTVCGLPGFRR